MIPLQHFVCGLLIMKAELLHCIDNIGCYVTPYVMIHLLITYYVSKLIFMDLVLKIELNIYFMLWSTFGASMCQRSMCGALEPVC